MVFNSKILTLPGYAGSGKTHWQSLWEKEFGFKRIEQEDWINSTCDEWVEVIDAEISKHNAEDVIVVAHSLGCIALTYWAEKYNKNIKGALLVAPCDTEAVSAPAGIIGFEPIPEIELPFKSIVVASLNDGYLSYERAEAFADCWGSELINIGNAGHINAESGYGSWSWGLKLLKRLD